MTARKTSRRALGDSDDLIAQLLLRIAAILLRLGLDSPKAERLLRRAFVSAALQKIQTSDLRPTQSRLASLAGLSRLEVRQIHRPQHLKPQRSSRIDQVVMGWKSDPMFLSPRGKPRSLELYGAGKTFDRLVKKYGRDVTTRTLRDEMVRLKLVALRGNKLTLTQTSADLSHDRIAAQSDLKFLASQLSNTNFQLGRRAYLMRQSAVFAENSKGVEMVKRIAIERLETVLSSLSEMSEDARKLKTPRNRRAPRLLVTTIVATEAEGGNK